jgi:hypothetical protein
MPAEKKQVGLEQAPATAAQVKAVPIVGSDSVPVEITSCRQEAIAEPICLSEAELEAWGATHRPPQQWYEQNEEDLS